jgi:hypothetical protein
MYVFDGIGGVKKENKVWGPKTQTTRCNSKEENNIIFGFSSTSCSTSGNTKL